ncbi:hypothetical protein [Bacillus sp. NPDC093026]|uniref:hypothetical protein n=1 Tax=Bacillus sp. NPDC093026 TaxID=3363948 RepID=UPI0038132ED2
MLSKDQNVDDLLDEVKRLKKECEQAENWIRKKRKIVKNAKKELEMVEKQIDEAFKRINAAHKSDEEGDDL